MSPEEKTDRIAPARWNDPASLPELLDQAHEYAEAYIKDVKDRPVFPTEEALAGLDKLDGKLPRESSPAKDVLAILHKFGSDATVAQTGGRYFGFVDGGMLPVSLAARWMADTWDQNTAQYVMSPLASRLEEICEKWIVELLGLPEGTAAGFVCGTTVANLAGICAARNHLMRRLGWDAPARGLFEGPKIRVLAGDGAHASVMKVASILGIGSDSVERVPADAEGRMIADRLPELSEPSLVITQAGNVNSGAFDPIGEICDRVKPSGSWVHVDGAFGLWAGASPAMRKLYAGCAKADSWSVDAHKTLNVSYDSGVILCRNRNALTEAFEASAAYFQWTEHREGMRYTPGMSRRARAVELWAVLRTLGRDGVAELVDQLAGHARRLADELSSRGFFIRNEVVFNQVLVACEDDDVTGRTLERLQEDRECWCGGSTWNNARVIRVSICDWSTTREDIDRTVRAFESAREAARSSGA